MSPLLRARSLGNGNGSFSLWLWVFQLSPEGRKVEEETICLSQPNKKVAL